MSNTVCCFHFSIVNQGKNISEAPKELENQPCRKFESCMIGETVGWYLRKNLVLFGPPDMQKTQEFPGFFGVVSFLIYPSGRVEQKRYRHLALPLADITREAQAISPRRRGPYHLWAFPLLGGYVSYVRFAAK